VPSITQKEWLIPQKLELREGIKKAIQEKVFNSILQIQDNSCLNFYAQHLGVMAVVITDREHEKIDGTISDYF